MPLPPLKYSGLSWKFQELVPSEITTLLIEGENDSTEMLEKECKWILENLGTNVPLHFSAFHPSYKLMNKPRTSIETLLKAYNIAQKIGLNYVYLGNISNKPFS